MDMHEARVKSIRGEYPERIPVDGSILPSAWIKHREALDEIVGSHPLVFGAQKKDRDYGEVRAEKYREGEHVDEWGCVWSNVKTGMASMVTGHPVPTREAGHYVYMHTDGHILEIIPDLIDCGVHVLNPQVGANGLEGLAEACRGRVCVDLDLNRQMFPFWKPEDIDAHVREAVEILGSPEGGLWLKAEFADDVPLEIIEAVCAAMEKYNTYYADERSA